MPHCIIEYSQNLEQEVPPADLLEAVKEACMASSLFALADIKLRSNAYKSFVTGGQEDAFVHVTIRMLSGRSTEQRQQLSHLILETLTRFSLKNVSFSAEICEMERETYAKKVVLSSSNLS
ncbi:5-carboxymethyl-2-hydroxymuconate Delta-isomerase [Marinomonas sp. IMCC 4694]|uniref:5-carboxymethyl-2-hydroxymuconate Delta-isomerase n=1 Tax=Marinomonas sp. IMCC 4694 TaxID=2605432 RepID=UPI0011E7558B|nr:5-carboxymethyl-2-hydroxymuconate Delta-isomerase [Marinomonas sp. IMCC 4694]TYL47361.1 5-carboxymethyl-2-hydroxymuconate Delta-isomerase [Marinomonas sp. IMCC 4694]